MQRSTCSTLFALALALSAGAAAATTSPWCQSGKPVKVAGLNWESGELLTELVATVLEQGYGCRVERVPSNTITIENALAQNDIQLVAEEWVGRSEIWNKAAAAGKVKAVGNVIVGATEGWYVPEYVVKGEKTRKIRPAAPQLQAVSDLPKYKQLFRDNEEPDKGRFLNCPSGWTCEGVNSQKLKAYGLTDSYVNFRPGSGAALDAAVASAYQRGQPVLFYYWSPTALMGKYRFIQLTEPAYNEACFKTLTDRNQAKPCGSAAPEAVIQAGVSRVFHDADPVLIDFLGKFNVPLPLLNAALAGMANNPGSAAVQSRRFFATRPDIWRAWVPDDVAQRIAARNTGK
ncbi:glycine betaine ABC transporter substrate-binding protein [Chitiniphilus eburneus]|uniref:ABC transporter substrate-binding protein n=1 Tax=Chitiniphilus eburneus TaxID=2571148 RepID=A0A4U0PXM7_9NEIS|nr:glycine betaine ABC transporter substrate-binding protein [Chitiniphilus eburneus]TJZ73000.1 ABC transporter substrate-binding protein [Chitiniphilus eburneus]